MNQPRRPAICRCLPAACLALVGVLGLAAPAGAQTPVGFSFDAAYQLQHDSNLFRLSPVVDPLTAIGSSQTSDTLRLASAGVSFDQRYSLQQVHAEVRVVDYDFQRFSQFDLTATNYKAHWDWAFTPRWQGRLASERTESIDSFDGGSSVASGANRNVQTRHNLDLRHELDGRWRLQAGLSQWQERSDQSTVGEDDYRQTTVEAGVRRSFGSGSHITARAGRSQGRNLSNTLVADNSFAQDNLWLDLFWAASGATSLELGLHGLQRRHDAAPTLDYSGQDGRITLKWQPTAKLQWQLSASSTLDSYQTTSSTHSRKDKLGLTGVWSVGARTALRASVQQTRLELLGHPSGGTPNSRRDRSLDTTLGVSWQPDELLTLDASIQRSERDSNQAVYDYSSTQFNVGITARF